VKITIELDGAPLQGMAATGQGGDAAGQESSTAPQDVLAHARAIGAIDGGAGPASLPQSGAPPIPSQIPGPASATLPSTPAGAVSGGAAPGAPDTQTTVVEQDPDSPTTQDEES
jgi:hypothetical protein